MNPIVCSKSLYNSPFLANTYGTSLQLNFDILGPQIILRINIHKS